MSTGMDSEGKDFGLAKVCTVFARPFMILIRSLQLPMPYDTSRSRKSAPSISFAHRPYSRFEEHEGCLLRHSLEERIDLHFCKSQPSRNGSFHMFGLLFRMSATNFLLRYHPFPRQSLALILHIHCDDCSPSMAALHRGHL